MHYLVPQFILDEYGKQNRRGQFFAACLFVDISGFSTITDSLMEHGPHGAETLSGLMSNVFDPLLSSVYEHGGFAATFAGDAFTAIFPGAGESGTGGRDAARRAAAAAWGIQQRMQGIRVQETSYGQFHVSVKVGLACGDVSWGIVASKDERRAAYYFEGQAIEGSAQAEHVAGAGDIILAATLLEHIGPVATAEALNDNSSGYYRLLGLNTSAPNGELVGPPPVDREIMARFYPEAIVNQEQSGEFRQILNLFVSLPTVRTEDQLAIFMRSVFALQDQYGGLLNRLDFGDKGSNLLMFWGAPIAYENDVARVLNFILDLQTNTSIPINAGITYRIAHAGFVGFPLREEYTCYGRGVNLAARFMTEAPRGEIWLDENVARHAERRFEIEYEGEMTFKGFADRQKVYALLEVKEEEETFYEGPMVGRQNEMDALADFVSPLWRNLPAGAMIVWGEPGMGKSRLIYEFRNSELIRAAEVLWAYCQSDEIFREAFNPFRYWLRHYFNQSNAQSQARNKRNFNRRLDTLIAETTSQRLAAELDRTRSFLGAMLDLYWPDSLYAGLDAQSRYENTLMGLTTLMQAESLRRPLIVHIEDNQWLDEASREFMVRLASSLETEASQSYPIALIVTSRREGSDCPLAETDSCLEIDLAQLSSESLADLACESLNGPVSESLLRVVVTHAEGNPFFAEQILHYLQERELVILDSGTWQVKQEQRRPLPADVRSVLIARLDRLAQEVKEVVQTAAILGREFEVTLLSEMLRGESSVTQRVVTAEKAAIWSPLSQMRYFFKHALLRDTAYRMQVRARRQALHQLAAAAIETLYADDLRPHYAELAYHTERAESLEDAADWYMLAADQAKSRGTLNDARSYYERALTLIPTSHTSKRWQALVHQIEVLGMLGDVEASQHEVDAALELAKEAKDDALIADAYYQRGSLAHVIGNDQEALVNLDAALVVSRRGAIRRIEALALGMKTLTLARMGRIEEAVTIADRALDLVEELGLDNLLVRNLNNVANFNMYIGDFGRAAELLSRQIAINRSQGDRMGEAHALTNLAYNQLSLGMYEAAQDAIVQALHLTVSMGARRLSLYNRLNLGLVQTRLGLPTEARQEIEKTREAMSDIDDNFASAISYSYLGLALEAGELADEAADAYDTAVEMLTEIGAVGYAIDARAGRCRCALLQANIALAERLAAEVWEYLQESGASGLEFPLLAFESCARTFEMADNTGFRATVEAGYRELMERADRISDSEWRDTFLHNVPEHRSLVEMQARLAN